MRFLEKLSLIIFSLLILIISVIVCLLTVGLINLSTINVILVNAFNDITTSNVILGVSIVLILLSLKNIFFTSSPATEKQKEAKDYSDGVLMQNENGQLLISKKTLQNLVSNIARKFEGAQNAETKVTLDKEKNLNVQVVLFVKEDAIIKDLSTNLQNTIIESVKHATDLDVKKVDIQIKNIATQEDNTSEN